jgi:hypothetical protein
VTEAVEDVLAATEAPASVGALLLLDSAGTCARVWELQDGLRDLLTEGSVSPGRPFLIQAFGQRGLDILTDRHTLVVERDGHALRALRPFVSSGIAVVERSTGRNPGFLVALSSTGAAADWLEGFASAVADSLRQKSRGSELALMQRYLEERSDSRHAVVALNDQMIITNAVAARMVGVEEQARLWEYAVRMVRSETVGVESLEIGRGRKIRVQCEPVMNGGTTIGVVMSWRRPSNNLAAVPQESELLLDLAGSGAKWRKM